ncbi:helix-turn-helix transcriptional regulator [Limnobaculum xujianqingii]|uniref:helix-turn-helix transcriptional regulator n=1 Tax=Limnobaculum xujianqingii TaxID=2738837 RepID=UPI0015BC7E69|nr:helix-turn-helix transcriptional regulator [Limnobaculum xujianqingii]
MSGLTPQEMVKSLVDAGYTQHQIAENIGVQQSSVSRMLTGVHTDPRFSTVRALEELYSERITDAKKA